MAKDGGHATGEAAGATTRWGHGGHPPNVPAVPAATPADAATVLLLRDGPAGVEVFLQRRGAGAAFMAGAYVFPGGTVEDQDRDLPASLVDVPDAPHRALRVAAIREAFEEAGVLVATRDQSPVEATWLASPGPMAVRTRLHDRTDPFDWRGWLADERLVLGVGGLVLASRWVTPEAEPRRYDTWFFVAAVPEGQEPDHDDVEMTDSLWTRPVDALAAADRGDVFMVPPTRRNLAALTDHATVADALDHTRRHGSGEPVLPIIEAKVDGTVWVTHPSFEPMRVR